MGRETAPGAGGVVDDATGPGILFLDRAAVLGGVARVILTAMSLAAERGYRPVLACPESGGLPEAAALLGFPVVPCRFDWMQRTLHPRKLLRYATGLWREGRRVARACKDHRIRVIHAHGPISAMYAVRAVRKHGIPLVYHLHDAQEQTRFSRLANAYVAPYVSLVVCVSNASAKVAADLGFPTEKTRVVYNGVDPSFLNEPPAPAAELSGSGPHIGTVGLIVPLKGQHVFLEAAEIVAKDRPSARFYIVGPLGHPDEQAYLDEVRRIADRPGLKGKVTFTGHQDNVSEWMAGFDVTVLASVKPEALPTVLLEAMALGGKVVATGIGGATEIVDHGSTGLLVPPSHAQAMADAIIQLVSASDSSVGIRAAAAVRQRFSPDRFGADLDTLYRDALALSGRAGEPRPLSAA